MELLYQLTPLNKTEVVNMIDDFIALQLLEHSMEHGRVLFVHDRIRDAFYHTLAEADKQKIHLQIALAIETMNRDHLEKVIYELAYHYVESGDQEKALKYVIPAAAKAQLSYANEEAIRFYQIGIELLEQKNSKKSGEWLKIYEELAKIYLTIGKNDEAILIADNLLNWIVDRNTKARLFKTIGIACFKKGDWVNCEKNLIYSLSLLGEKLPQSNVTRMIGIMKEFIVYQFDDLLIRHIFHKKESPGLEEIIWTYEPLSWLYMLNDNRKLLYNIIRLLNISNASTAKTKDAALATAAFGGLLMSLPFFNLAEKSHKKSLNLRKRLNDEWGAAQSLQLLGYTYGWHGNYLESINYFEESLSKIKRIGDLWETGMTLNGLGLEYFYCAEYRKSIDIFNQYLEISQKIKDLYGICTAIINTARCYIEIGDFGKAEELLYNIVTEHVLLRNAIKTLLGIIKIEKGDYLNAITDLEEAQKIASENLLIKNFSTQYCPYLADAYLRKLKENANHDLPNKELTTVRKLCSNALKQTKSWANNYGISLLVAAKYFVLIGKNKRAGKFFTNSIIHNEKTGKKYELARSYYEFGIFWRDQHNEAESIRYLKLADKIFNDIAAQIYLEKCRKILDAKNLAINESANEITPKNRLKNERQMEIVLEISRDISSILDIDNLLEKIMDKAIELVGAERGLLLLYPETGEKKLQLKVLRNIQPEELEKGLMASFSIISRIETEQRPIIVNDAVSEADYKMQSSVVLHGIRSVLGVPIRLRNEMLGILYLNNNLVSGLFLEDDLKIIDLLLNQAGISIENARLYNRLTALNQNLEKRVRERTIQLENLNQELTVINEQLKQHAATIEELAVVKERNRLASEVHDTLGHTMTSIKALLDLSLIKLNNGSLDDVRNVIKDAHEFTKEGMGELRRSILGLSSSGLESNSIIDAIKSLIIKFESLGVHIDFSVDEPEQYRKKNISFSATVYRLCQEALTNSIRHGKAKNISIIIQTNNEIVRISIIDDGCGCKDLNKGFGLSGMEQRVKNLNGKILFGSDGVRGFNMFVEIPVKELT